MSAQTAGATATPVPNETLDSALVALLAEYPDAHVAAIGDDGLFIPVPPSVPLQGHRMLQVRSTLELVVPEERELVLRAWERARSSGAATVQLHLRVDPDRIVVLHYLDARPLHGVYLGVLVGTDGISLPDLHAIPPLPPRIARVRKNELAVFTAVDEATTRLLGWTPDELLGHRSLEFIHPDDQERAIGSWMQMLSEPDRPQPAVRLRHRRADGSWAWFEVTNHNRLAEPSGGDVLAEMIDISDEMAAHEALQAREQLLHRLAEALPIGVFQVLSDGRIAYTNERLQSILGVGPAPTVVDQLATVAREDWPSVEAALEAALGSGIDGDLEIQVRPSDEARTRRCLLRLRALTDGQGAVSGAVVCVEDVTASAQLRAELERRASHDLLTRLLNRASVLAALEGALASQGRGGTAAIFIDLDDFKGVNDRLGHVAGASCSARWPTGWPSRSAAVIRWAASGVMSSWSSALVWAVHSRPSPWPSASRTPCASRSDWPAPRWSCGRVSGWPMRAGASGQTSSCGVQTPPCIAQSTAGRAARSSIPPRSRGPATLGAGGAPAVSAAPLPRWHRGCPSDCDRNLQLTRAWRPRRRWAEDHPHDLAIVQDPGRAGSAVPASCLPPGGTGTRSAPYCPAAPSDARSLFRIPQSEAHWRRWSPLPTRSISPRRRLSICGSAWRVPAGLMRSAARAGPTARTWRTSGTSARTGSRGSTGGPRNVRRTRCRSSAPRSRASASTSSTSAAVALTRSPWSSPTAGRAHSSSSSS